MARKIKLSHEESGKGVDALENSDNWNFRRTGKSFGFPVSRKLPVFEDAQKPSVFDIKVFLEVLGVYAVLALALAGVYYLGPSITGFATVEKQVSYTDNVDFAADESDVFVWTLGNAGKLKSVKIDGVLIGNGSAKAYIEHEGARYLVLDSSKLAEKPSGLFGITGFVVKENGRDEIKTEIEGILNEEQNELFDLLVADINSTRNNVEIEIDADEGKADKKVKGDATDAQNRLIDELSLSLEGSVEKIKIKIEAEFEEDDDNKDGDGNASGNNETNEENNEEIPINETPIINETPAANETQINETLSNETQPGDTTTINETIKKTIDIDLEYGSNEAYDANNDGIETLSGAVDFAIDASFNWDADESKLCARYEVFSIEDQESDFACYGNSDCCILFGLESSRELWNDGLFLSYGSLGSTENNIVFAQVLYANYSLNIEEPYSDVAYSSWKNLTAEFIEGIEFEDACLESCIFEGNETRYNIIVEVENAELRIKRIDYVIEERAANSYPILLKEIENISIVKNEKFALDLRQYFNDGEGDELSYSYLPMENVTIEFDGDSAHIMPSQDFTGTRFTYIEASDSYGSIVSNVFKVEAKEEEIPSIEILNVSKNYENITVSFKTAGKGNLTIEPIGGARFGEAYNDNLSTYDSLEALELKCGSFEVFDKENLIETENAGFILGNGSKLRLSELLQESAIIAKIHAEDYSCNEIGHFVAKVLDDGRNILEFKFGEDVARATTFAQAAAQTFEIRNKEDVKLAVFDSFGNLSIRGSLLNLTGNETAGSNFAVHDSKGGINLVITNPDGNMHIKGSVNENQSSLTPEQNSFIIQNANGEPIAYISDSGNIFLKGALRENAGLG